MRKKYETDLTDEQWEVIKPLFVNMRKRKWDKRELVNAVLYLVKTGCQWRNLPHDFPPVFTVHSFYRRARLNGLWNRILEHLVKLTRQRAIVTDEIGCLLSVVIHKANKHDTKMGYWVAGLATFAYPTLEKICGDGGYHGSFVFEAYKYFGLRVEISKKLKPNGLQMLPKRWIVERTFAWLNHSRRLSKDYERTVASAETLGSVKWIV